LGSIRQAEEDDVIRLRLGFFLLVFVPAVAGASPALVDQAVASTKATVVKATEIEWGIKLSKKAVPHGKVTFAVHDAGALAHQFIVLKTNLAQNKLPMKGAVVDLKKAGKVLGRISVPKGKTGHLTVTLAAGRYVLLCNLPSHYKAGQHAAFKVT
jgi:uncharacterized cupredoxin-like copper-binding protein